MKQKKGAKSEAAIFILAGGQSLRMGRDKARLQIAGRSFLDRITATASNLGIPVEVITRDLIPNKGPLGGVYTALKRTPVKHGIFLSCDMPLVTARTLERLLDRGRELGKPVFTQSERGAGFPFLLGARELSVIEEQIERNQLSLHQLAAAVEAESFYLPMALQRELTNINTPQEYEHLLAHHEEPDPKAVLHVRNLGIRRNNIPLVTDFSWRVQKGEHWVVLGPNGSGKTSILNALLGYITPTSGDILVLGEEYGESDWPALRRQIGLVSSSIRQMMPETEPAWITIASGKYAMIDFWGTPRKEDKTAALKLLRQIECEYLADRPWYCLSQGERQRVLIARALMPQPALLVLDEPCAGLDPAAREHFLQFLQRLGSRRDAPALVLVTHHVEEIMPVFTHCLLLDGGRKKAAGPLQRVLTSKNLTSTFGTEVGLKKQGSRYSLTVKNNPRVLM